MMVLGATLLTWLGLLARRQGGKMLRWVYGGCKTFRGFLLPVPRAKESTCNLPCNNRKNRWKTLSLCRFLE